VVVVASSEPWALSKDGSSWFWGKNSLSFTNFGNSVAMNNEIKMYFYGGARCRGEYPNKSGKVFIVSLS
jgi:hypothetical protein